MAYNTTLYVLRSGRCIRWWLDDIFEAVLKNSAEIIMIYDVCDKLAKVKNTLKVWRDMDENFTPD